jgi:hypothetical protein
MSSSLKLHKSSKLNKNRRLKKRSYKLCKKKLCFKILLNPIKIFMPRVVLAVPIVKKKKMKRVMEGKELVAKLNEFLVI